MLDHRLYRLCDALLRAAATAGRRLRAQHGQGTIEYVGLMVLMSILLAAVVAAGRNKGDSGLTQMIIEKDKGAIDGVGAPPKG